MVCWKKMERIIRCNGSAKNRPTNNRPKAGKSFYPIYLEAKRGIDPFALYLFAFHLNVHSNILQAPLIDGRKGKYRLCFEKGALHRLPDLRFS